MARHGGQRRLHMIRVAVAERTNDSHSVHQLGRAGQQHLAGARKAKIPLVAGEVGHAENIAGRSDAGDGPAAVAAPEAAAVPAPEAAAVAAPKAAAGLSVCAGWHPRQIPISLAPVMLPLAGSPRWAGSVGRWFRRARCQWNKAG